MSRARDLIADALPAYEIGIELGRGAWSVVYSARHRSLDRQVAIKQLPPAFGADPAVRARFVHEARLAAGLDHPHIVPVHDFVESDDGGCLIVMERCTGTLAERFHRTGVATDEACAALLAAFAALDHAHRRGVLHRDVKPENLLYDSGDVLKLGDFGIARAIDASVRHTATGTVMGTPAYMSPEQATGAELGPHSDLYGAGVVLYELLSGELPFAEVGSMGALVRQHLTEQPRPLTEVAPVVPTPIAAVVDRLVAKDPADRPADAMRAGIELAEAASHAFGPGWLRRRRFVLHADAELLAATERDVGGAGRAGTVVVKSRATTPDAGPATADTDEAEANGEVPPAGGVSSPPTLADLAVAAARDRHRPRRSSPWWGIAAAAVLVAAGLVGLVVALTRDDSTVVDTATSLPRATPSEPAPEFPSPADAAPPDPALVGASPGPGLVIGVVGSGRALDEDHLVAIELAIDDIVGAGGTVELLEPVTEASEVPHLVAAGATVIIGPGDATATMGVLEATGGRAVLISHTDFFDRPAGPTELLFRTRPRIEHGIHLVADLLPERALVLVVSGTGPESRSHLTAAELARLLEDSGRTAEVVELGDDTTLAALPSVEATLPSVDAAVLVGVTDPAPVYEALLDLAMSPALIPVLSIGHGGTGGLPDGAIAGVITIGLDASVGAALEERLPAVRLSLPATAAYDAVILAALAAHAADDTSPTAIADLLPAVSAGGTRCTSFAQCRDLLDAGVDADYDGPSGALELSPTDGRPLAATVRISTIGDRGFPEYGDSELVTVRIAG